MGNHKRYRIKSLYDNKMAVRIDWHLVRPRMSSRTKATPLALQMRTIPVISSRTRRPILRPFLINFVSLNLMELRRRLRRRMIVLRNCRHSSTWLISPLLRPHRTLSFSRDSLMRWTRCIIGFPIARFRAPRFMVAHRSSHAITTVADAAVTADRRMRSWQNI